MTKPTEQVQPTPPEQRSPEKLRADIGELRAELGETVEELVHRADVPARARAKKHETVLRVRQQVTRARDMATEKAPEVRRLLQDQPAIVAGAAVAVAALVAGSVVRRRRRT